MALLLRGMPVLAETAAAVSALSGGGWQAGLWAAYAGWHSGLLHSGVARPDCLGRWLYLELATDAGSVWLPFRRVGPVQLPRLTASGQPVGSDSDGD